MILKNKSLVLKLIIFFSGSCSLILLGIFLFSYQFSKKMIMKAVDENARNLTLRTVNKIDGIVLSVQKIPLNLSYFLENAVIDEEQMHSMLRMIVAGNKEIYGACMAFEPYAFKKNLKYYDPYYFEEDGKLKFANTSNYFLDDFYQIPKELNAPVWSEPYVDEDANILMTTYSVPFYENKCDGKNMKGIIAVDVSLEWLQSIVSSIKILRTGYAFLISRNGTVITHRNKDLIMNDTIFSAAEETGDIKLRETGRKMINGESGFMLFNSLDTNKKSWMAFYPVPSTGWSLGLIFPEEEFMEDVTKLNRIVVILGFIGIILLVLIIIVIANSITRSLRAMTSAVEIIGTGNLDVQLPTVTSNDEVGKLTKAFEYMKASLKKYIKDLQETTAAKERIESELKIAHEIQSSMLPRIFPPFPDRKEFELFATMDPAKEVGGDFYDFFLTSKNKLFFLIGDVSGKGVPAALFMMITKTLMKNEALQYLSPQEVLYKVNNIVAMDNDSSMFATIFCGVMNTETGEIEFSNAGHNPPVLCRKGQKSEFLNITHGFVLGPMPNLNFSVQKIKLEPGDMLFMYTDGVTEAMNTKKELFSEERLLNILINIGNNDAASIISSLRKEIKNFAGDEPQSDDITMLALRFRG